MKTLLPFAVLFVVIAPVAADPSLTIYNENFAVVRDTVPLDLKEGVNDVSFTDTTSHLEPDSVILRDPSGKVDLQILEQNYRNDPISQDLLLSLNEGQTIDFLVQQGDATSKTAAIETLLQSEKLNWAEVCFVGDDIIDLGPLTRAGLAIAVGDGVAEARAVAHHVTQAAGGRGAVREAVEMILKAQDKWQPFLEHYTA